MRSARDIALFANTLRQDVIRMLVQAKSGHTGGALGTADFFAAMYYAPILNYKPSRPKWIERDRFVLSNGHICPILYATLARVGVIPLEWLNRFRALNSPLQGHPNRLDTPGVEVSTGPLGQGIGAAVGMAMAARMDQSTRHVYCMVGDGEMQEGAVWEAIMLAGHQKLAGLTVFVDRNYLQIEGETEDIVGLDPLKNKFDAFNWDVMEVDGHSIPDILHASMWAKNNSRPTAIILDTIMGKNVSFMENDAYWHGNPPNEEQAARALVELEKIRKEI